MRPDSAGMRLRLHLARTVDHDVWRSAREAIPEHRAVVVEVRARGESGWGEAPEFMTSVYSSRLATLIERLRGVESILYSCDPERPELTWARLAPLLTDCPFALGALDVACHDLAARLAGVPLYERLGCPDPTGRRSAYSIGLDEPEAMVAKLPESSDWHMYKVKLGKAGDLDVLRLLRKRTDAPFWLDGNAGWARQDLEAVLGELPSLGVAAIEQPFPVGDRQAQLRAREVSPVPIFADESVTNREEFERHAGDFDGVNVKILKAGGITPSLEILRACRERGVSTMLGCLPESSIGASAAAHLSGMVDHVDVDTIALLATDTGTGIRLDGSGRIGLPDLPGTGFVPDAASEAWVVDPESVVGPVGAGLLGGVTG